MGNRHDHKHQRHMSLKRELQKNKPGLTVIELLISTAIFVIVILVIGSIFLSQINSFNEQQAKNKVLAESLRITRAIKKDAIQATSCLTEITIGVDTYTADSDTLILSLPALNASDNIIPNEFDTLIIDRPSVNPSELYYILSPSPSSVRTATQRLLTSALSDFIVRYNDETISGADSFSVTSEVKALVKSETYRTFVYTTTYTLRN